MFKAFAAAVVLAATAAQAADQFDLICTGSTQTTGEFHHEPISRRYHVDLTAKQWCYDGCTVKPLAEVNPGQIVFEQTKPAFRGDHDSLDYVDRTTGKWAFYSTLLQWQGDGTCQVAPFSGFPSAPTKF